ncbi:HK97 family phage prohead protease [Acetobacter orientalis]|uniref:HK97 family phage prohead protease n=1 Tax=Acetobacter orientalis TaxID=146474 RepID=UPI00209EBF7D|nr:HK97 family phage prohead protease [Acetobacter orientalis]MCP1215593.1 HK97 family phage prohead protease [Acetobacter orientalis]MCP1217554.1 HK97 family phage prohead protease [Acetobacter orientalis]
MRIVSPARFAKMAWDIRKRGASARLDDVIVKQTFISKEPLSLEDGSENVRQLRYIITTDAIDRMQDKIAPDGWDLTAYLQNPVVLWGHNHDLVIGKAVSVVRESNGLSATVEFQPSDMPIVGPWADYAYRSGLSGFVRATSVGFYPKEWEFTDDDDRGADDWFPGIDFKRQELTEFSVVSVPANPEALLLPDSAASPPQNLDNPPDAGKAAALYQARAQLHATRARGFALQP